MFGSQQQQQVFGGGVPVQRPSPSMANAQFVPSQSSARSTVPPASEQKPALTRSKAFAIPPSSSAVAEQGGSVAGQGRECSIPSMRRSNACVGAALLGNVQQSQCSMLVPNGTEISPIFKKVSSASKVMNVKETHEGIAFDVNEEKPLKQPPPGLASRLQRKSSKK